MFDIEMPTDDLPPVVETPTPSKNRRGPMATAINENAASNRERADTEAAIRAENDALAHEHVRMKKQGLIVEQIELHLIDTDKLTRDRADGADPELDELKTSISQIGLSNPIKVEPTGQGRFELIQGYRRLSAYRALLSDTDDAQTYGRIPASVQAQGNSLEGLYRQMVDENMIRKDISFAEMAQLAMRYAADPDTPQNDPNKAVAELFSSANYARRSYIRNFISLLDALGDALIFPQDIPRALGIAVLKEIQSKDWMANAIKADLGPRLGRKSAAELDVLRRYAGQGGDSKNATEDKQPVTKKARVAKTTFQLSRAEGAAKCTASSGRLEIRLPKDFSAMDRLKLEAAVAQMLDALDD
ncbi:replication protein [Amylibacter ulvae]|uniref:Replication protein n=2 Tax=Paramylibacter ulvae TaxID=1651968 RepID=A0ABQ3DAV4_9RHOB|nr:replication protein [Amylibacter ulvae]